jgi:hypothetical protein
MAEVVRKGIFDQGVENGETKRGRSMLLTLLQKKFHEVPKKVEDTIQLMTDPTALESLAAHVLDCQTLEEFENALP